MLLCGETVSAHLRLIDVNGLECNESPRGFLDTAKVPASDHVSARGLTVSSRNAAK
jgi:hypothetical protein